MRDQESMHHKSMDHLESIFLISQSYKALQGTNLLLGRHLNEDIGKMEEQPIIPNPAKLMFAKKSKNEVKNKVPSPLELNQIFREYLILDPWLKRDINFNVYLEILELKGSSSQGPYTPSSSWGDKRDLKQKINKMQVPMYDTKRMMARYRLHQL